MNKIKYLYKVSLLFFCSVLFVSCSGLLSDLFNLKEKLKGVNGSIYWNYNVLSSILTIDGTTNNQVLSNFEIPEISKDQVYTIILGNNISEIGDHVFANYNNLSSITIPASITTIGEGAFSNCISLSSITIPSSVNTIKNDAFSGWQSDQKIILEWVRIDATSRTLDGLNTNNELTILYIDDYLNDDHYLQKNYNYDHTGWYAIKGNTLFIGGTGNYNIGNNKSNITTVIFMDGITYIKDYAFQSYTSLSSISIPDSVTSIGSNAFENCTSLLSISIPNSVTYISSYVFNNCTSLNSIILPNSIISISSYTFGNCTSLSSITIPSSVTYFYSDAFADWTSDQTIILDWSDTDGTYRTYNGFSDSDAIIKYNNDVLYVKGE